MSVNNNYTLLARGVQLLNNPTKPYGTLLEEIPSDIGRSYEGYKRGGFVEGAEKMRKELMSAVVWLFGIPAFNMLGNLFCENVLKIPTTKIDFSNPLKGNDAVNDTAKYLTKGIKKEGLDYSDLDRFVKNSRFDFKNIDTNTLAKRISGAKKVTSIAAVVLNCLMMGVVIPKINQVMTNNFIQKQNAKKAQNTKNGAFTSFEEFKNQTKKESNEISFKGLIPKDSNDFTYQTENNSRFRLIITDIPMIIGRMATSRTKFEALEYLVMDGGSIFFYNFSNELVQKIIRKNITKTPGIQPTTIEALTNKPEVFKKGLEQLENNPDVFKKYSKQNPDEVLKNIFSKDLAHEIYGNATFGKYGRANRYVENSTLEEVNQNVEDFMTYLKSQAQKSNTPLFKDGNLNTDFVNKTARKIKYINTGLLGIGLLVSIIGLSVIIPKATFALTKLLTGKNEFTGLANYDEDKKQEAINA